MRKIASAFAVLAVIAVLPTMARGAAVVDQSFGDYGVARIQTVPIRQSRFEPATAVAEQRDGKLIVLGNQDYIYSEPNYRIGLMSIGRFTPNGKPDTTFGRGGINPGSSYKGRGYVGYGDDLAVTRRDRIFAAGPFMPTYKIPDNWTGDCMVLSRYRPDGSFDIGFGDSGQISQCLHKPWISPEGGPSASISTRTWNAGKRPTVGLDARSIDLTGEGKILIGGQTLRNNSETAAFVARFNQNGKLDRGFKGGRSTRTGDNGIVEIRRSREVGGRKETNEVLALRHRKVLAVGELRGSMMIARLRGNGSLDSSFGAGGVIKPELPVEDECCATAETAAIDNRGRILVAGYFANFEKNPYGVQPVILRLLRNGSLDRSFGTDGISMPALPDFATGYPSPVRTFWPTAMVVQKDGRIVLSGNYNYDFGVMRLTGSGKLDKSFFEDGMFDARSEIGEGGGTANDLLIDRRGRIVVAGAVSQDSFDLVRILP
ncbi:MAG: hypothetical protein KDB66_03560 [Solirubrobacterales bacterium]|nr:hypothetical protein [Solirubrobacterales bacterium]MCB8915814.1 hypothetical protein [Thermoleophilales bacterium]